jgi:pimeloyl-ACP methyl ester carboxylesterase
MTRNKWVTFGAAIMLAACASVTRTDSTAGGFVSDYIDVVTRGGGPDLIFVHGLAGHRDLWTEVAHHLDDRYRLHLVQIKGFAGIPARGDDTLVVSRVAQEVGRYIREKRLNQPAILGHSMGGSIALMVAAREPGLVERIIIVDMMPFLGMMFGGPQATAQSVRAMADQMRTQMLKVESGAPGDSLTPMMATMTRVDRMKPVLVQYAATSDRRTVVNAFHELIVTDLRPELARITVPVIVLYAVPENSPETPENFEAGLKQAYSNARNVRLVRIPDANHYIHLDNPARFVGEVDMFMQARQAR